MHRESGHWKKYGPAMLDIILEPPTAFWNVDTQFGRGGHYINHPTNMPTIQLKNTL